MQKKLFLRLLAIVFLMVLLLIPLGLIRGVVSERQGLQSQVENTIAMNLAGPQRLAGPLLVVPYVERETVTTSDDRGRDTKKVIEHQRKAIFMAENLTIDASTGVESRYKGLYKALVYQTRADLRARFNVPANLGLDIDPGQYTIGRPWIAVGLGDVRGLRASPVFSWDKQAQQVANGPRLEGLGDGLHAMVALTDVRSASTHDVDIRLDFAGTSSLAVVPLGNSTVMQLKATWPHPNFGGRFLPQTKSIDANGFTARWEVSHLSSRNGALIRQGLVSGERDRQLEAFDVGFIEPVNIYQQAERAVKYGILFVVLTFAAFFLFEVLKELRIHPLQYGLVGMALAIFFLLLVSLSEHISFLYAYLAASSACVLLIGYYLSFVLRGWRRGVAFAGQLAVLYAVLYGLLLSEDNALMLGSLLLFFVLATVMVMTRRIDWYQLGGQQETQPAKTPTTEILPS
ncbi:MAG: cell envelope integrity protein CreD [Betaproteobacteria bacterium]|nr:cell envelope integrity protein CreD [Betaproteobacteria bacterium]